MKDTLIKYCKSKKGSTMEYPFGPDPTVFKVGGKIFALIFEKRKIGLCMNLKCDPHIAENLREQHTSVLPGYHMNKAHWNTLMLNGSLDISDVKDMVDHSYDLVFGSLSKRNQASISNRV